MSGEAPKRRLSRQQASKLMAPAPPVETASLAATVSVNAEWYVTVENKYRRVFDSGKFDDLSTMTPLALDSGGCMAAFDTRHYKAAMKAQAGLPDPTKVGDGPMG